MEFLLECISNKKPVMKKRMFVVAGMLAASVAFAQDKKEKQPPPPPPPPAVMDVKVVEPPPPPPTPAKQNKEFNEFMERNPTVKGVDWNNTTVRIRLKSGKEEVYDMKKEGDVQKLKEKYGELPPPPPPPPPPPKPAKVKTVS